MAEESSQEKNQEPTAKKLLDSRKKGQVVRSREFNTTVMLLASSAAVFVLGGDLGMGLLTMLHEGLNHERINIFDVNEPVTILSNTALGALLLLSPLFVLLTLSTFIGPLVLGGWSFSSESFKPQLSRMSLFKGLKRMLGLQGLVELLKAILKFLLLALVSWALFYSLEYRYLALSTQPLEQGVINAVNLMALVFFTLSAATLLISMLDVPYQKFEHTRKLRMSLQEVKEEQKESDGNPEVRGRIRRLQHEAANRKMLVAVKTADVIITNPTHYSIALSYDQNGKEAPVVVAKGVDHMAMHIRKIAIEHKVPLFRAPVVARSLYRHVELDQEIPAELYGAIAKILAYVFQLEEYRANSKAEKPLMPVSLPVPEELQFDGDRS